MKPVLIGQSYFLRFDPKLWEAMQPYPPLGALYAAGVLRQRGYPVAVFDAMLAESEDEWAKAVEQSSPQFAVLFEDNFNYLSKMCLLRMRQAALAMIRMAKERGSTVLVCGADASDHAEEYLALGADFVLLGEGEQTLVELLDALSGKSGAAPEQIHGLAFKQLNEVIRTPHRQEMRDLDAVPFPAWDLVDIERYRTIWLNRHGLFSMNMVTTRGCPFHCNWCAKPIWGQRYHSRSPENVIAEMERLKEHYAPDHIWFADDILGLKPGWLARFGDLVVEKGLKIPFKCLSRADLLTRPGEVPALQRAGAQTVWLGAESGSQKILDAMEKGTRVEQIRQAASLLKTAGIEVGFFLQFGYPGETRIEIEKTLELVRACSPDDIGISVSYPMPGTKFFAAVKDELGLQQNWHDSNDLAMLYHGTYTTAFYRQLHRVVHHEFRARKSFHSLKKRFDLRQAARLGYNLLALPAARWRLERLGALQNPVLTLPHIPPEQAAVPTPQETR